MDLYDWMLALHLLAAFAVAAALVLFSVLVVAGRRMETLDQTRLLFRLGAIGNPLIIGGMALTLLLGIVLAIDADAFSLWDGWVLAAILLWAIMFEVGRRSGVYYDGVQKLAESGGPDAERQVIARLRAPTGARLHYATVALFLLLVLVMIYKPGA